MILSLNRALQDDSRGGTVMAGVQAARLSCHNGHHIMLLVSEEHTAMPVIEFRVALTAEEFDRIIAFYRDGLGLEPGDLWTDNGRGQIFAAGRATLEVLDPQHAAAVDQFEVGQQVSGQIRFAFEVPDVTAALERALRYGAALEHEPVLTPWNHLNARVQSPDGLQITLFQDMNQGEPPAVP